MQEPDAASESQIEQVATASTAATRLRQAIDALDMAQKQLVLQERLSAVGQLSAGIAHDFNNILAIILLQAQLLLRQGEFSEKEKARVETIIEQSERGAYLIQQILDFSRKSVVRMETIHLNEWLVEFVELLRRTLPEWMEIELEVTERPFCIEADSTSLQQLFLNLALNARDAIAGANGHIRIQTSSINQLPPKFENLYRKKENVAYMMVQISDSGNGMSKETLMHIYEPFFTTKPKGSGVGLGLAQAYGIVKQHFGFIDCESKVGVGTTFTLYFPLSEKRAKRHEEQITSQHTGQKELILLVEDDQSTQQSIKETLQELNYNVIVANNGDEALVMLGANHEAIDLVLSDIIMPEIGGVELQKIMRQRFPRTKMVLMSGYAFSPDDAREETVLDVEWIAKPFTIDKLSRLLQRVLGEA